MVGRQVSNFDVALLLLFLKSSPPNLGHRNIQILQCGCLLVSTRRIEQSEVIGLKINSEFHVAFTITSFLISRNDPCSPYE